MAALMKTIDNSQEGDLVLESHDLFRLPLKQIGNSITDIRQHFSAKDGISLVPKTFSFSGIRDDLITVLRKSRFLHGRNIATNTNIPPSGGVEGFVFLSESLGLVLDFPLLGNTRHIQCDAFIAIHHQPVLVLTIVDIERESETARVYNADVAREVTRRLRQYHDQNINVIFGVLSTVDLKSVDIFQTLIMKYVSISAFFVTESSLLMNQKKYEKMMLAFWAGVAETKSVLELDNVDKTYLRFLTMEQCIVLVENINNRKVTVSCQPGCGATTLMLEVARRLSRLGETLLVCRSEEERDRLRPVYSEIVSASDIGSVDLSKYTNVVDETGTVVFRGSGRLWKFAKAGNDIIMWLRRKVIIKKTESKNTERLLYLLNFRARQTIVKYLAGELDVLFLCDLTIQRYNTCSHQFNSVTTIPQKEPIQKHDFNSGVNDDHRRERKEDKYRHLQEQLHQGLKAEKDLFPILGNFMTGDKKMMFQLRAKTEYIEQVVALKRTDHNKDTGYTKNSNYTEQKGGTSHLKAKIKAGEDTGRSHRLGPAGPHTEKGVTIKQGLDEIPKSSAGPSTHPDSHRPSLGSHAMKKVSVTLLECPHCPKQFKTERGCKSHIKRMHSGVQSSDTTIPGPYIRPDKPLNPHQVHSGAQTAHTTMPESYFRPDKPLNPYQVHSGAHQSDTAVPYANLRPDNPLNPHQVPSGAQPAHTTMPESYFRPDKPLNPYQIHSGVHQSDTAANLCPDNPLNPYQVHSGAQPAHTTMPGSYFGPDNPLNPYQVHSRAQPSDTAVDDPYIRPDSPPVDAGSRGKKRVSATYLECPYCSKPFKNERTWKRHIDSFHSVQSKSVRDVKMVTSPDYDETRATCSVTGKAGSDHPVSSSEMMSSKGKHAETPQPVVEVKQQHLPESDALDSTVQTVELEQTGVGDIAELTDELLEIEKDTDRSKAEVTSHDDHIEWDYNLNQLSEVIEAMSIKDSITDVVGDEILPIPLCRMERSKNRTGEDRPNRPLLDTLHRFQHGTLKHKDMFCIVENVMRDDQIALEYLQARSADLEQVHGIPVYIVGEPDSPRSSPVTCPAMTLDTERVNGLYCHISEDGELVSGGGQPQRGGFNKYSGTCSRLPFPLPASPSSLTTPRYWETHTRVRVERERLWWELLEMGVCQEGEVDTGDRVSCQSRSSWAVLVTARCFTHRQGVCTQVWREGRQVGECRTNTMSRTPGTTAVFKYGVVLDVGRGRLGFIDLDREIVLHKFDVQFTEPLRPMFGVDPYLAYTVKMRLVSGGEITMPDTKKDLIAQVLTTS